MQSELVNELAHRRIVRSELRELIDYGINHREALADLSQADFIKYRVKANEIFTNINHAREMQLDAIVLKEVATAVSGQASRLEDFSIKFDSNSLTQVIRNNYYDNDNFQWAKLGNDVGVLFRGIPEFQTMTGPLYRQPKVRKAIERKQKDAEDLSKIKTTAATLKYDENDEKEATTTRKLKLKQVVTNMTNTFNTQVESGERPKEGGIDLVRLLIDPHDPVQTIENVFDFSFLIKEKEVLMTSQDGGNIPVGISTIPGLLNEDEQKQKVVALDMKQLKKLSKMIDKINSQEIDDLGYTLLSPNRSSSSSSPNAIQSFNILHRNDEIYLAKSAVEQTEIITKRNLKNISQPDLISTQKKSKRRSIDDSES